MNNKTGSGPPRISLVQTEGPITPVSPGEKHKTHVLTLVVIVTNVIGNIFLSHGMRNVAVLSWSPLPYLHAILNPWVAAGVLILTLWMITDLALLSLADLSYVLPVTATAYILIAILGHFVLDEPISGLRWGGIVVITLGVMLVGKTPSRTTPEHHHIEASPMRSMQ
jgi:drug/metabolite transporter (DMT)-like permease